MASSQNFGKENSVSKCLLNPEAPVFHFGREHYYTYNIFAQIFLPALCRKHCQNFVGNAGCVVCYYMTQELNVESISDSAVGCELRVNAHNSTDYTSICSKKNRCQTGSCQPQVKGTSMLYNTFENISYSETGSHQIFFDTFTCINHGSLNEAFLTNGSLVSIDSMDKCMEQDLILESSNKAGNIVNDQYWSANTETLWNDEFSNNDISFPSKVYPDATYNTVQ